jgi:hypothetical protein
MHSAQDPAEYEYRGPAVGREVPIKTKMQTLDNHWKQSAHK